jgi:hypothetical protein
MVTIKEGRHRGKVGRVIDIKEKSSGLAAKIQLRDEEEVGIYFTVFVVVYLICYRLHECGLMK